MATVLDIINIVNSGSDVIIRKTKRGYVMAKKPVSNKSRINSDPRYDTFRKTRQEFCHAASAGKVIRLAFNAVISKFYKNHAARMMKVIMECLKADTVHPLGDRDVVTGNLRLLEGFNFNEKTYIDRVLRAPYQVSVDRATGTVSISIPAFVPAVSLASPSTATHFKVIAGAALVDFATKQSTSRSAASSYQPIDNNQMSPITLSMSLPADSTLPVFVLLGINFYQEINGNLNPLAATGTDACTIVKVDL